MLRGLKHQGDKEVFTYQDLIDGKVTVSITDPIWSSKNTSARIDLNPGHFSSFGSNTGLDSPILADFSFPQDSGLLGIAEGTIIENAAGGNVDDVFYANHVANRLDGDGGNDTVSYRYSDQGVTVALDANIAEGGYATGDELINIENLEGSGFDDVLTGNAGSNHFEGLAGAGCGGSSVTPLLRRLAMARASARGITAASPKVVLVNLPPRIAI